MLLCSRYLIPGTRYTVRKTQTSPDTHILVRRWLQGIPSSITPAVDCWDLSELRDIGWSVESKADSPVYSPRPAGTNGMVPLSLPEIPR